MKSKAYTSIEYIENMVELMEMRICLYINRIYEKREISRQAQEILSILKNGDVESKKRNINERIEATLLSNIYCAGVYVESILGLNEFEKMAFILSIMPFYKKKYQRIFAFLQENNNAVYPTVELVYHIYSMENEGYKTEVIREFSLRLMNLLFEDIEEGNIINKKLVPRTNLLNTTLWEKDHKIQIDDVNICIPYNKPQEMLHNTMVVKDIFTIVNINKSSIISICGVEGIGKHHLVKKVCGDINKSVLFVDLKNITTENFYDVLCCAILQNAFICIDCKEIAEENKIYLKKIVSLWEEFVGYSNIIFLLSTNEAFRYYGETANYYFSMEMPTRLERQVLWQNFLKNS